MFLIQQPDFLHSGNPEGRVEIKTSAVMDVVEDVICDVCRSGTRIPGYGLQYGKLEARWGYGAQHDGKHYCVHLYEECFFSVLGLLRRERMVSGMFDDEDPFALDEFGLISRGNY